MKVTKEQIEAAKTARGGWTRETLAQWGVSWPPPKGWKERLLDEGDSDDSAQSCDQIGLERPTDRPTLAEATVATITAMRDAARLGRRDGPQRPGAAR